VFVLGPAPARPWFVLRFASACERGTGGVMLLCVIVAVTVTVIVTALPTAV
jgi:hypothetical protein